MASQPASRHPRRRKRWRLVTKVGAAATGAIAVVIVGTAVADDAMSNPTSYRLAQVITGSPNSALTAVGTIEPARQSTLTFPIGGRVATVARRPRSLVDRGTTLFVLTGLSMPTFLVGLLLLYVLFFRLRLLGLPASRAAAACRCARARVQWALHLVLPWVTLAIVPAASYTRLTRTSLLEVFGEDYVRTARAKGITERRVVYRHALRSALTPLVTQLGVDVGRLLGGAIVTETVFGLPGLGQLAVQSITAQVLPVIVGIVLLAALFVILANMVVDVCYAVIDPRIRVG